MSPYFEKNKLWLENQSYQSITIQNHLSDFSVLPCSIEGFYLIQGNHLFNSKHNSINEASNNIKRFLASLNLTPKHIVITGLELGYHTIELLKQANKHTQVWVCEISLDIINAACLVQDFTAYQDRLHIFHIGTKENLHKIINSIPDIAPFYFNHQPSQKNDSRYMEIYTQFKALIDMKINNILTINHFQKLWIPHFIDNISTYIKYPSIKYLKPYLYKHHCVIVAAGPSLESNISFLKSARAKKYIIIAVNTVIPRLVFENITPDIIVAIDPQNILYYSFIPLLQKKQKAPVLVAEPTVSPAFIRHYPGPIIFSATAILESILPKNIIKQRLDVGGSVATFAYSLAIYGQVKNIVFLGLDMSYSNKSFHLRGNEQDLIFLMQKSYRLSTWEMFQYNKAVPPKHSTQQNGHNGKTIFIDAKFISYIKWFENRFQYYQSVCNTYNVSNGYIFKNIINTNSMPTSIRDSTQPKTNIQILPLNLEKQVKKDIYTAIKQEYYKLKELEQNLKNIKTTADFSLFIKEYIHNTWIVLSLKKDLFYIDNTIFASDDEIQAYLYQNLYTPLTQIIQYYGRTIQNCLNFLGQEFMYNTLIDRK